MKRPIVFVVLTVIALAEENCGDHNNRFPVPPSNATAESFVSENRTFPVGTEEYTADFGTITVPENRSNSASRLLSIPFLRIRSHAEHPAEPIFGFAGGPGQSNMSWDWGKARTFLSDRDFVVVGYRGVDGSSVLDCPEVAEAFKGSGDLMSDESMRNIGRAWRSAAKRLKAGGVDLNGYTMLECIEDNESVRRGLGYARIDLLSESYGTRVAYLYALRHPEQVFRSAMISVNPPGHFVWDPRTIDAQLRYYAALWSGDSTRRRICPDIYASMRNVLRAMPRRWLFLSIDPGKVRVVTFALLFHRNSAAAVFNAYIAADHGDPSGLALMSLGYDYIVPSLMTWGDLASKALSADYDSTRNYAADMDSPDTPLGSPMGELLWGSLRYVRWPMNQIPAEFRRPRPSDVETLLLSGSVDFSTPPENATKDLLPMLKNGRQVILSECGHVNDIWYLNEENTRLILRSFFNTGTVNVSLNTYHPMSFDVKWGFPLIAKAALGVLIVIVGTIGVLIFWLVRRRRELVTRSA
jgi:pimeloyl-ACP methyl ester carboxylesterase